MKKLVACLALLGAVGCSETKSPTSKKMSVETLRSESVALIEEPRDLFALFSGGQPRAFCSGVWVSPSSVLTANHCVDQEDEETEEPIKDYLVTTADDVQDPRTGKQYYNVKSYEAHRYATDVHHDLALIHVASPPPHAIATVARGTVVQGAKVFNMGQSKGLWFSFASGDVAALREENLAPDEPKPAFLIQATVPTSPGNSGGGLFNETGELIGICHGAMTGRAQNLNFYIDTRYIRAFLDAQGTLL